LNRVRWLDVVEGDLLQNDLVSSLGDGWGCQRYSKRFKGVLTGRYWPVLSTAGSVFSIAPIYAIDLTYNST
jgi:hypothetical protein